jgi:hypothetical protein
LRPGHTVLEVKEEQKGQKILKTFTYVVREKKKYWNTIKLNDCNRVERITTYRKRW